MAIDLSGIVTWLKGWFYDKSEVYKKEETYSKNEVNNALSGKLNSNLVTANKMLVTGNNGDVELENKPVIPDVSGKIDTAGTGLSKSGTTLNHSNSVTALTTSSLKKIKHDAQGHITETSNVTTADIPNSTAFNNIKAGESTTLTLTDQAKINEALNTKIGEMSGLQFIVFTDNKGTASADTMNKLYVVTENNETNYYYTTAITNNGTTTYDWEDIDSNILADVDLSNYALANHQHGQITNDGKITSSAVTVDSADNIVITDNSDSNKIKKVSNLLASQIKDGTAYTNIDSSANDTQSTINSKIDTALGDKADDYHSHGVINKFGSISGANNKNVVTDGYGVITTEDKPTIDSALSSSSTNAVQNKVINTALDNKADNDHTHWGDFTELQALITNASSGDTIILDKDYRMSFEDVNVSIDKSITIIGNGHTLDADGESRVFTISHSGSTMITISLSDLYLINGDTSNSGGAIKSDSYVNLYITNCSFDNNNAGKAGGAISTQHGTNGSLILSYCDFNNNTATTGGGAVSWTLSGNINICDCVFNNNQTGKSGGAISNANVATEGVIIKDCVFKNNVAVEDGNDVISYTTNISTIYNCETSSANLYNVVTKPYLTDHQSLSNYATVTALNGKQDIGDCITSIDLVPKSSDNTGAIRLYYGDEPSNP